MLLSYFISSGALGSPDLLLSSSIKTLPNTHNQHTNNSPYPYPHPYIFLPTLQGFVLCYVVMPALGLGLGKAFKLPVDLVAGVVLVGCINGGQASNLCTYIAKGDVALSVREYVGVMLYV